MKRLILSATVVVVLLVTASSCTTMHTYDDPYGGPYYGSVAPYYGFYYGYGGIPYGYYRTPYYRGRNGHIARGSYGYRGRSERYGNHR